MSTALDLQRIREGRVNFCFVEGRSKRGGQGVENEGRRGGMRKERDKGCNRGKEREDKKRGEGGRGKDKHGIREDRKRW